MSLRRVTEAEISAAKLRRMARDLILEAERLEASVGPIDRQDRSGPRKHFVDPITGKRKKLKDKSI